MSKYDLEHVQQFVSSNITLFHTKRLRLIGAVTLSDVLRRKNPYLFRAKNITVAADLVRELLDATLSSSEELLFSGFLEDLAVFIAQTTSGGRKSAATGLDLEFESGGTHYLVSTKSGSNWGNSSQQKKLEQDFQRAVTVLKQSGITKNVQPVLGICYGKTRTSYLRNYLKVTGQSFWYLVSRNESLHANIVEPLGYKAQANNDHFLEAKAAVVNRLTQQLLETFSVDGAINWARLVEYNSGNIDIGKLDVRAMP